MTSKNKAKAIRKSNLFLELSHQYEMMAIAYWDWTFPKDITIPVYIPEQTLYRQGQACMIQIPGTDDYGIFPVAYGSVHIDLYGRPAEWRAYTVGDEPVAQKIRNTRYSSTGRVNTEPSVLIWNDFTRNPSQLYVDLMIEKMLNTDVALESNINAQKTPFIVNCNQQNLLTAKNFYKQIQEDADSVFRNNDMGDLAVEVLNLGVQFIGAELSDQYKTFENRILEYLGINSLPVEKQERMLTGEVTSNDDKTNIIAESRLFMRERATKEMKEIFGLDVEVKRRELPQANTSNMYGTQQSGGEDRNAGEKGRGEQQED